jgi:DNA topoisomerase-1
MVLRHGRYGEFISCSGYPECKYIKQNFIGVKCPQCKDGELVEKKARRRGNIFYGCSNYPKCDFTSAYKPMAEKCPECGSPYLLEKHLKSGSMLVCPNNTKKSADEEEPKPKRGKKGKAAAKEEAAPAAVKCDYSRPIPAPAVVA